MSGWCKRLGDAAREALERGAPEIAADYSRRTLSEPPAAGERAALLFLLGTAEWRAGQPDAIAHLEIEKNGVTDFVIENPDRVGYREALQMSKQADMQLLVGDTTPYYAASKMMGLVASGKPFFAWVHTESFPAQFLEALQYPHRLSFQTAELGDEKKIGMLADALLNSLQNRGHFVPVPLEDPVFINHTARAMTKIFADTFQKTANT